MSWPKGHRGKRRIWQKFAKGFDEGNDLGRRALSKVANLAKAANLGKMANLVKICQRV